MMKPPRPKDERERLETLREYEILDSPPEQDFDDLVLLASKICDVPIALISLVDSERQWFKARVGLSAEQTHRDISFCGHAILQPDVLVVPDAVLDVRFADNPLVTGDLQIRFYAGAQLQAPDGQNIGTICIIDQQPRSLTEEQKEALRAIARQVIAQLELRRFIRRLESARVELQKAKDLAQRASLAKSEFLAQMSHEVRTPMSGIIGLAHLLLDGPLTAEQREHVEGIVGSSNVLMNVVNDILDDARIEAGKLQIERVTFDLEQTMRRALLPLRRLAEQKGLRFDVVLPAAQPPLVGDPLRLSQVVTNLVGNAIKFTDAGSVRLVVERCERSFRFVVEDTGVGMSEEVLARLFARFAQADAATPRRHGGTGLGLNISKNLVELMGGSIGCTSAPGKGSRFWFELPLVVSDDAPAAPPRRPLRSLPKLTGHVMVADDNPLNRQVALALLAKMGLKTSAAENGQKAVELWQGHAFDLILMDGDMPILDGYAATQRIRAIERESSRRPVPIVAVTANALDGERQRCHELGFDDFLPKPFDPGQLRELLGHWLPEAP